MKCVMQYGERSDAISLLRFVTLNCRSSFSQLLVASGLDASTRPLDWTLKRLVNQAAELLSGWSLKLNYEF